MKRKVFKIIGALVLIVGLLINYNWSISKENKSDLLLKNAFVIAQAQLEGGGSAKVWRCYATYNSCWFWNCSTIYRCGSPCTTVSADSYSDWDACTES